MTTDTERLDLIGNRVQAAKLRRLIRYMKIDEPVIVADGAITRLSNRQVRYDMRGVSIKFTALPDKLIDYLLVALELETVAQQEDRRQAVIDSMEEIA